MEAFVQKPFQHKCSKNGRRCNNHGPGILSRQAQARVREDRKSIRQDVHKPGYIERTCYKTVQLERTDRALGNECISPCCQYHPGCEGTQQKEQRMQLRFIDKEGNEDANGTDDEYTEQAAETKAQQSLTTGAITIGLCQDCIGCDVCWRDVSHGACMPRELMTVRGQAQPAR